MSKDKDPNKLRAEEKTRIVQEAIAGGKDNIKPTAEKYDIDVELLETWIHETDVTYVSTPEHLDDEKSVDLEVTEELANDYKFGATPDKLNYPRLTFWSIFGTSVMLIIVVAIFYIYDYTFDGAGQTASEASEYYQIGQIMERDQNRLNSFGVVDLEEGVYRIPIDSVITRMATDSE